jgi:FKBP-type peptidyl-prolyl cis-trans isomerase
MSQVKPKRQPAGWTKQLLVEGTGETPKRGQTVVCHYVGTLESNGKKFDSSRDRGQPFKFKIGKGEVIKGWDEGIATMLVGEKSILTVQPHFGYGSQSISGIPGNSVLIFEVELFGIQ